MLLVGKLKRHFVFCAHECDGTKDGVIKKFCDAADHYSDKFGWPENEREAFRVWLKSLVEGDAQYFMNGLQTSCTESFHNVCNVYCPKGFHWNFKIYSCRKNIAALAWNTKQGGGEVKELRLSLIQKILSIL